MCIGQILIIDPIEDLIKIISELQVERLKTIDKETAPFLTTTNNNVFWILSCLAQKGLSEFNFRIYYAYAWIYIILIYVESATPSIPFLI